MKISKEIIARNPYKLVSVSKSVPNINFFFMYIKNHYLCLVKLTNIIKKQMIELI